MPLSPLNHHQHIALDLDECLFGGNYEIQLRNFIELNPSKTFSIITNRPASMHGETLSDIDSVLFYTNLNHTRFAHIISSPSFDTIGNQVFPDFKGRAAKEIGATIIADDDVAHKDGCDKHRIEFLLLPYKELKWGGLVLKSTHKIIVCI